MQWNLRVSKSFDGIPTIDNTSANQKQFMENLSMENEIIKWFFMT